MPTDYVLFIHGTYTRSNLYADKLVNLINHATPIKPLVVYWGNVSDCEEEKLRDGYRASGIWDKLWFRDFREQQLLPFVGDTALYISRYIGAKVAALVAEQVVKLKDYTSEDRLHLVTHSLGTVILFDILFGSRWGDKGTNGHDSVMTIRNAISGVDHNRQRGIRLGSITTMGSPLGIFRLMDVNPPAMDAKIDPSQATSTHDITPSLVKLLEYLHQDSGGSKLPWRNFVHPGDPLASPLEGIVPHMIDANRTCIDIQDILVPASLAEVLSEPMPEALLDLLAEPFKQTVVALLDSGNAHGSYWHSSRVAEGITQLIQQARAS